MWTTMLEIIHCPYCGIQLPGLEMLTKKLMVNFSILIQVLGRAKLCELEKIRRK